MSWEIVKSIKIRDNEVFIKSGSNNCYPHHFEEWHAERLSKILQEKGLEACEVEILKQYENGNFQKSNNKYTRALQVLRHFPEYKLFDWRPDGNEERRKSQDFIDLLKRALKTQLPKDKFIIKKEVYCGIVYLWKKTSRYIKWHPYKEKAKIFRYLEDAKIFQSCYSNSGSWIIEKLGISEKNNSFLDLPLFQN